MARSYAKQDFPLHKIRRYLEPGPIVLVSSAWKGQHNIMTMGWHTVMEFSPSLVGCVIASSNHSFELIRQSRECVINLPTAALTDAVVGIGTSSGVDIDKFERFGLTPEAIEGVKALAIRKCHAQFACRLHDESSVDKYNFFIWEVVAATVVYVVFSQRVLRNEFLEQVVLGARYGLASVRIPKQRSLANRRLQAQHACEHLDLRLPQTCCSTALHWTTAWWCTGSFGDGARSIHEQILQRGTSAARDLETLATCGHEGDNENLWRASTS